MRSLIYQKLVVDPSWLSRHADNKYARRVFAPVQKSQPFVAVQKGVAIIPVYGFLTQRQSEDLWFWGGTSTDAVSAAVVAATNNRQISAILLDVDSPGGMVYGIEETAAIIREAASLKPVYAIANSRAMSGAYWLASAVGIERFFATSGADVGSIGVFVMHEDISGMLEMDGVKVTCIHAGEHKVETLSCMALSDSARAHLQRGVDETYAAFVRDVAAGRGTTASAVVLTFGGGRAFGAATAENMGMVDGVKTMQELFTEIAEKHRPNDLDNMDDDDMRIGVQRDLRMAWKLGTRCGFNLHTRAGRMFTESVRARLRRLKLSDVN